MRGVFTKKRWAWRFVSRTFKQHQHAAEISIAELRLFSIVQPYAPARVWRQGRGNLKQLVTEWCQHHPAYAGLEKSAWCIRLKDDNQPQPQVGQKHSTVSKFCLEYTP